MSGPPPPPPGPPNNGMRPHPQIRNQMAPGKNMGYNQMGGGRPFMPMQNSQMGMRGPGMYQQGRQMQQRPPVYGMPGYQRQQQQQQQQQSRPPYGSEQIMRPSSNGQHNGGAPNTGQMYYQQQQQQHSPYRRDFQSSGSNIAQQQQQQQEDSMRAPKGQLQRTTIDYYGATLRGLEIQQSGRKPSLKGLPADPSYTVDVFPSVFVPGEPETSITTRFVQQALNKQRFPVNVIRWTPEGRRLITGSSRGELTLWSGLSFNFETIMTAHDTPIHAMEWSHDTQWMISGGHDGIIKYWHPNLNNLNIIQGHKFPVRDLSFSPTDLKFVSASDDQQLKIWDFRRSKEENSLSGHTWEVRAVDWHPHLGMIASGGKDNMIRVWDPRSAKCLASIGRHNNSITSLEWNQNGRWLLSGGRDHCMKLFDVRNLKEEIMTFATPREIHTIAWHPVHETMFASGGSLCDSKDAINEGTIQFWMADDPKQKACIEGAHSSQIWSLAWHPMGHILASGSNDKATRFWCRPRPGEHLPTELGGKDADERIFHGPINAKAASQLASYDETAQRAASADDKDGSQMSVDTSTGEASPVSGGGPPKPPGGGLPGLQAADIGQMLAKIKQSGIPGLGDRMLSSGTQDSRNFGVPPPPPPPPPQGYPPAGLPGLSKSQGLPGLTKQQHPPPPPPLNQLPGTQYAMPPSGPVRSESRTRQSSRFNPIQHSQLPPPPPPPPPPQPSSGQNTPTQR